MNYAARTLLALTLLWPVTLSATESCMRMDSAEFVSEVLKPSDLIAYVKVLDYSTAIESSAPHWTKAEIVEAIYSRKQGTGTTIAIKDWQASDDPLFGYTKGDYLVLFLKETPDGFLLANSQWKSCVPAIWNAKSDQTAYRNFQDDTKPDTGFVSLAEIKKFVEANL